MESCIELTSYERQGLYSLLVQLFSYPDHELIERLQDTATCLLSAKLKTGVPLFSPAELDLTTLESAYTSLFINHLNGVTAPPYGSVYLDKEQQVMGPTTLLVAQCYRDAGLTIDSTEPADFIATELEFLYYLVGLEEDHSQDHELFDQFFKQLFLPWIPQFCGRLNCKDIHPLYIWAAGLLSAITAYEENRLN